jgi:hypothetical protein
VCRRFSAPTDMALPLYFYAMPLLLLDSSWAESRCLGRSRLGCRREAKQVRAGWSRQTGLGADLLAASMA